MNAGLPGTGLGGLFYVLLALWMPVAELYATLRGRSSAERWRQVTAQFFLACGIVVAVVATVLAYFHLADVPPTLGLGGRSLAVAPVVLAGVLLVVLVTALRVWARFQPALRPERPALDRLPVLPDRTDEERSRVPAGR